MKKLTKQLFEMYGVAKWVAGYDKTDPASTWERKVPFFVLVIVNFVYLVHSRRESDDVPF